jgi:hypothetical protein
MQYGKNPFDLEPGPFDGSKYDSSSLVIIADDTVIATSNRLVMETDIQTQYLFIS